MAEHPHVDRKDLKGPDAFFQEVGRVNRFIQENQSKVVAAAAAALVLFLGGVAWSSYRSTAADKTAATFLRATDALDLDSLETAKAALKTVAERGSGAYEEFALIYTADIQVREDQIDAALESYTRAADEARASWLEQIALMGKGFCLERLDRSNEAAQAYARAAALDGPHREQALRGQLRTATMATDKELSAHAAERLIELYPDAEDANELAKTLAALQG